MTFIDMCLKNKAFPEDWKKWLDDNKKFNKNINEYELLGLLYNQYKDLIEKRHSFQFYFFKRHYIRNIYNLWPGCYVKFINQSQELTEPHFQYGWVDVLNHKQDLCKIQCDDSFDGNRAIVTRIIDVMEILPYKERPLCYYKTMICGECNLCDRTSNKQIPLGCPNETFFDAILNKQKSDQQFIKLYFNVKNTLNKKNDCKENNCIHCNNHCNEQKSGEKV